MTKDQAKTVATLLLFQIDNDNWEMMWHNALALTIYARQGQLDEMRNEQEAQWAGKEKCEKRTKQ